MPDGQIWIGFGASDLTSGSGGGSVGAQLGVAAAYALLAYSGISNTGNTTIVGGNIGSGTGSASITGFPPGVIALPGVVDNADAGAAQTALAAAIVHYQGLTPTLSGLTNLSTGGNGATASTYTPGVYVGSTSLTMPTGIILDAQGNPNATFVFVAGSTINLATLQSVTLVNGAQAGNVVFVAGTSFTSVATSVVNGNILAASSVTLGGGTLNGRALANTGAVTISATAVTNGAVSGTGVSPVYIGPGNIPIALSSGATAYVLDKSLSYILFRTGMQDDLQEAFGGGISQFSTTLPVGARGLASPPAIFTTPAGVSGPPGFPGITQLTPVTVARPKGIEILTVTPVYEIGGAAATLNTIAIYQTAFVNGVAPAVTTVMAPQALTLAAAANPYVTPVPVPTPGFLIGLNDLYSLEWKITTGAGGNALLYGVVLAVNFNYA